MQKQLWYLLVVVLISFSVLYGRETKFLHYPDIHGNLVVFNYAGDLWSADITDGLAFHLTTSPGNETYPRISPDGKWIAFTAEYDGNPDVYVIPVEGGEPKRLTYHGAPDNVVGWTPDGKQVLFVSYRDMGYYGPYLYVVGMDGGLPERVLVDRAAWGSYNADGSKMAFNRRAGEFRNWKRYHGGEAQDVWIADFLTNQFKNITPDYSGVDQRPLWAGNEIYFLSDRQTNVLNLWAYNVLTGEFSQKTNFKDYAVYAPGTDGKSVVFEHGGSLYVYNIAADKTTQLQIYVPSENWQTRPQFVNPTKYMGGFAVTPDGKWAVVDARGDIYKIAKKSGKWVNLTHSQGVREQYPRVSPDGKYVAYFSDRTGDDQLYIQELKADAAPIQLTSKFKTYFYHPVWSPDSKKIAFGDKDYILRYVDIDTRKVMQVDRSYQQKDYEFYWEISQYDWSPDSRWLAYSKVEPNLNSAIYLYSLGNGKSTQLTSGELDDFEPVFDRGGDYLYFLSNRHFSPALDPSEDNFIITKMGQVCVFQLKAGQKPPFAEDENSETSETGRKEAESEFRIDLEGIQNRVYTVPIESGAFQMLLAGKDRVYVMGKDHYGFPGLQEFFYPGSVQDYFIKAYDMKEKQEATLLTGVGDFNINPDGNALIYRSNDTLGIIETDTLHDFVVGDGALQLDQVEMYLDRRAEYRQIFNEIWRWYRDFFYDPNMQGNDWEKIRQQYLPQLEYVQTRQGVNELASEMVGELCASHMYIFGGDENPEYKEENVTTGLLGSDIYPDPKVGLYKITKIFMGKSWDEAYRAPLAAPDVEVKEGDYLLEIDGHPLKAGENYLKYLLNKANKEVEIVVAGTPEGKDRRIYTVEPVSSERKLREWNWVKTRDDMVRKLGNGEIAYMHMDDMDEEGLGQFEQGWKAGKYNKGLILDVRYNGGGFTNYFVIDKLERELTFGTKTREFVPMRFPMAVSNGKMVSIINEFTGSDGELYTDHFKARKLGKVVGHRTWGGLIGIINSIPTVDGGIAVQPNVGFYDFEGKWVVENWGAVADPGLDVDILPSQGLKGEDPQLKKAIEVLTEEIRKNPPSMPGPPAFPIKTPQQMPSYPVDKK